MELEKTIYTTRDIAKITGLTTKGVTNAIRAGRLKADKLNNSYFITRENLADYLEYRTGRNNGRKEADKD